MSRIWVLVASHGRARLFESDNRVGPLREIASFAHPQARLHERDLVSDAPGRSFDRRGEGRHAHGERRTAKRQEAARFAKELAAALERGRVDKRYDKLYVVAEARFLGQLRECLDEATRDLIAGEIDRNVVTGTPEAVREQLPDFL